MKSKLYLILIISSYLLNAQVGINTNHPDPSASLDLGPGNRAMTLPKVALNSLTDITTIPNPSNGLMIYNTKNDIDNGLIAGSFYIYNSLTGSWEGVVGTNYANEVIDNLKPPKYVGQLIKTDQQILTNLDGNSLNVLNFPLSTSITLLNQDVIERLPGSSTTFKVLKTGTYIFEGYGTFSFTANNTTFWTIAIQEGVSDDSNVTPVNSYSIGMRCPYYNYERSNGFFSTCNFTGAVKLNANDVIRMIAIKKNGVNPTSGKLGDGVNFSAGLKVVYFSDN